MAVALVFLSGCGLTGPHITYYTKLNDTLITRDFQAAEKMVAAEKSLYNSRSKVLHDMDRAMVSLLAGRHDESNRFLQSADALIDQLYTKSLTRAAVSFLTSDALLHYEGEAFEKIFLNLLGALNYAILGRIDDSIVEARRADLRLQEFARQRQDSAYVEDPFVRFFMGLVYEDGKDLNDAWISYARAIQAYEKGKDLFGVAPPAQLVERAAGVARVLGFTQELDDLRNRYPDLVPANPARNATRGRIVLVHMAGMVPLKGERRIDITLGSGMGFVQGMEVTSQEEADVASALSVAKGLAAGTNIAIAVPFMVPSDTEPGLMEIGLKERPDVRVAAQVVHRLTTVAPRCLDERMAGIWGKTVARAVVKFLLSLTAGKVGEAAGGEKYGAVVGALAYLATSAALNASERADSRSWGTLPAEIRLAVLEVPPGRYTVTAGRSRGPEWQFPDVVVDAGRSSYRVLRSW